MSTREPQVYDTISKGGVFWRVVSIENGIITAKRLHGADNGLKHKTGRPLKGTKQQIEARGYHFCDIPPVKVSYQEPKPRAQQEGPATAGKTGTQRRETGEKEQRNHETEKTAEKEAQPVKVDAAREILEAEDAEHLKEDSEKLQKQQPAFFRAFRVRLISGREHTVRPPQQMTTEEAVRRMVQGTFVADAYGAYFASEQIESVTPIKERT